MDTIILSSEGLAPLPQDSDYNPDIPKGIETLVVEDNIEEFCVEEDTNDDWTTYCPSMLQTRCHPLLSSTLISEVSTTTSTVATTTITTTTAPITPAATTTAPVTSPTATTTNSLSRRRPVLKRKSHGSASSKFEELAEKKLKIVEIKHETAIIDRETAKTNLAIAQAKLRIVLLEEKSLQSRGLQP
ncbi:hypothetical protein WDU94_000698 [Cyamophila willieti]